MLKKRKGIQTPIAVALLILGVVALVIAVVLWGSGLVKSFTSRPVIRDFYICKSGTVTVFIENPIDGTIRVTVGTGASATTQTDTLTTTDTSKTINMGTTFNAGAKEFVKIEILDASGNVVEEKHQNLLVDDC